MSAAFSRAQSPTNQFVNFETSPIDPLSISADGKLLAVANLADSRVEIFNLQNNPPTHLRSIFVGIDPTSLRFRNHRELWVVNHISDSINVVDTLTATVTRVIPTLDGPSSLVFAREKAFVSCPPVNTVQVFDLTTGQLLANIPIEAERPRALAVSPDGEKVYAAILESGNQTTILAPRHTRLAHFPSASPVDYPEGPHGGLNPPPNTGTTFTPPLNPEIPSSDIAPRLSLIVKKVAGRWLDDNGGDWTEYISGEKAPFTGRLPGWDVLDHDIAVINTQSHQVEYIDTLMNIGMSIAVSPLDGTIALAGTDALNHLRFEPVLQSVFLRINLALVKAGTPSLIRDLNSHLDYELRQLPTTERRKSISEPRSVVWNPTGDRLFVTGMGTDNLLVLDAQGNRIANPIPVGRGPAGLAYDTPRNRLYVLNRFEGSVSIVDAATLNVVNTLHFYDPTPVRINLGRKHFYNSHETSGLGQVSCSSCHIDARFDRLAWDLGTQIGDMKFLTNGTHNFANNVPVRTNHFHPMKGPMVTQTLQDIIGHEPFHWRGDRSGIEEFNPTFEELQGKEKELSAGEMQEFEDFLSSLHFPPNRFRNFDNSLPARLPLPGHFALGRDRLAKGEQFQDGNAQAGFVFFRGPTQGACMVCHTTPSGHGTTRTFQGGQWRPIPPGPNGEQHKAMVALERSDDLPFKIAHLRNLPDKVGLDFFSDRSPSGFGFMHDGRVDSLTRFLQDGFNIRSDQNTANLIAFLLAFSGSDLAGPQFLGPDTPLGDFSRDAPASAGRQLLVTGGSPEFNAFLQRAHSPTGRVQLVLKGIYKDSHRGFLYDRATTAFLTDRANETVPIQELLDQAGVDPLLAILVPQGTGHRLGLDRDTDGVLDGDEAIRVASPLGVTITYQRSTDGALLLSWQPTPGRIYLLEACSELPGPWREVEISSQPDESFLSHQVSVSDHQQQFFRVRQLE